MELRQNVIGGESEDKYLFRASEVSVLLVGAACMLVVIVGLLRVLRVDGRDISW